MRINISLAALAAALVATPALAAEDNPQIAGMIFIPPMSGVRFNQESAPALANEADATSTVEIPDIKFDLANVGGTKSASELSTKTSNELPASTEEKPDPLITGGISINRRYGFSDRYIQINSPTAKAYASVSLRDIGLPNITLDAFGAHGLKNKRNRELDLGGTLHDIPLGQAVTAELSVSQYFLANLHDITTVVGKVSSGAVDASVTHYMVHREPDATKVEVGYTRTLTQSLTLRPLVVFEHGFGLSDEFVGGLETSFALGHGFSLTGAVYTALYEKHGDPRGTVWDFGISFNF